METYKIISPFEDSVVAITEGTPYGKTIKLNEAPQECLKYLYDNGLCPLILKITKEKEPTK